MCGSDYEPVGIYFFVIFVSILYSSSLEFFLVGSSDGVPKYLINLSQMIQLEKDPLASLHPAFQTFKNSPFSCEKHPDFPLDIFLLLLDLDVTDFLVFFFFGDTHKG